MGFPLSFSKSRRAKKPGKGRAARFRALEERALLSAVRVTALDFLTFEGSYSKTGVSDPERFDWHEVGCGRSSGGHTAACWGSQESYRQDMLSMSAEYADGLASETALKNAILTARGTALSSYVTALENADSSTVTLGLVETDGPFTLTETDLAYGAGISQTLGNVSGSILIGAATGGITKWASVCSNASKGTYAVARAINAWDAAGNVASVATSVYDMSQNGLTAGNVLTAAGSVLGLSGNISGAVAKRACFTAGTQVLVGETTETVDASDGPYSFVVDNTTAALWIVVGVSATASFAVRQLNKRLEKKAERGRGIENATARTAQAGADYGDSLGGALDKSANGSTKRFPTLSVVSVCLLLISLAALFFAINSANRVNAKPEAVKTSVDNNKRYITKNIEDIRIGDDVLAYDVKTGRTVTNKVTSTFSLKSDHLRRLAVEDGNGGRQTFETTDSHPFWVVSDEQELSRQASFASVERDLASGSDVILERENLIGNSLGYYVEAKDLQIGDRFIGPNGEESVLVGSARDNYPAGIDVYNFQVANTNNYFVTANNSQVFAYANPVLVHNANCSIIKNKKSYDLVLSFKEDWDDNLRQAAIKKVNALTKAKTVVTHDIARSGKAQREARRTLNLPSDEDADHIIDLQLGGLDSIENIWGLPASVNRSLGSQINALIKDLPEGAVIRRVTIK